jgi:uncharacterized protein (TIGR00304 family)
MQPTKVFIGFVLLFIGISLLASTTVKYGGVIIFGPFPIILASSPDMAIAGMVIAAAMLFILLFLRL